MRSEVEIIKDIENDNWWFKSRNEFINFIIDKSSVRKNKITINLGCGTNYLITQLHNYKMYGVDNNLDLDIYQNKLIIADASKLPFKNSSISTILLFDVMEHIKDDTTLVREINRILAKNGNMLLSIPAFRFLWGQEDVLAQHYRRYTKRGLKKLFYNYFHIKQIYYWNFSIFFPLIFLKLVERKISPKLSEVKNIDLIYSRKFIDQNKLLNKLLYNLLKIENYFIKKGFKFPFGITIFMNLVKK